jgi:hypothetical protein
MARVTRLKDLLITVELYPIFASISGDAAERRLPVPDKGAIVNTQNCRVLGVVSRYYL